MTLTSPTDHGREARLLQSITETYPTTAGANGMAANRARLLVTNGEPSFLIRQTIRLVLAASRSISGKPDVHWRAIRDERAKQPTQCEFRISYIFNQRTSQRVCALFINYYVHLS